MRALYRKYFRDVRRERQFLAWLSFLVTFGVTRWITHSMRLGAGPFRSLFIGDTHVHHLVWGILLLIAVGYMWLIQVGTERSGAIRMGRITAMLWGVGAALTLDEFALWLNLEDVYWEREGRASVDVTLMYGALVSAGLWGGPFLRALWRQALRIFGWSSRLRLRRRRPVAVEPGTLVEEAATPLSAPTSGTRPDGSH